MSLPDFLAGRRRPNPGVPAESVTPAGRRAVGPHLPLIRAAVAKARDRAMALARELGIERDGLAGWCDNVSLHLSEELRAAGLDAALVLGRVRPPAGRPAVHWWVQLGGAYIDATADQFNRRFGAHPFPALVVAMPDELPSHRATEVIRRAGPA